MAKIEGNNIPLFLEKAAECVDASVLSLSDLNAPPGELVPYRRELEAQQAALCGVRAAPSIQGIVGVEEKLQHLRFGLDPYGARRAEAETAIENLYCSILYLQAALFQLGEITQTRIRLGELERENSFHYLALNPPTAKFLFATLVRPETEQSLSAASVLEHLGIKSERNAETIGSRLAHMGLIERRALPGQPQTYHPTEAALFLFQQGFLGDIIQRAFDNEAAYRMAKIRNKEGRKLKGESDNS